MSLNDFEDKKLKSECISLIHVEGMYKCMVMPGPPPLIAEMFDTWDSTYDAYCERCVRFVSRDPNFRDWSCIHILEERARLWLDKREKWISEASKKKKDE